MFALFKKNRNFRALAIFFILHGIGAGMFGMIMMWIIHAMYQNPVYTGIAGFLFAVPFVTSFIVGPLVDRWRKTAVLRTACFVQFCVVAVALAAQLVYWPGVWLFFVMILAFSLASLFFRPAQTAILPRIVDGEDLVKANAFINIVGVLAGTVVFVGTFSMMRDGNADNALLYAVMATAFGLALIFSIFLRCDEESATQENEIGVVKMYLRELTAGFVYAKQGVFMVLLFAGVFQAFFADVAGVNVPMFAEYHFGSASGYIILAGLTMFGGMIGSIFARMVDTRFSLGHMLIVGTMLAGVLRILFVFAITNETLHGVLMHLMYVGVGSMVGIFHRAIVQKLPPKNLVGRVDTMFTTLGASAGALGALAGGFLGARLYSVDAVFFIHGAVYIILGLGLLCNKKVRALPALKDLGSS
ncbi:MAG: MFS transporter [Defluviitaleaceae bacterium]|nr:MFS transporter [Defluviitaleaceae bacterium]MCL2261958.1 MFS transporter [Defluviitaleaceae bacterium]